MFIKALLASAAALSATCAQAQTARSITVREARSLSDQQLVRRALDGLADNVVEVSRPPEVRLDAPFFSGLGLTLRPRASEAIRGVCVVQQLHLEQRSEGAPEAVDPPVTFDRVSLSTTYTVVGEADYVEENAFNDTDAKCAKLTTAEGTIGVSEGADEAVVLEGWKLLRLASQQASDPKAFRLDCVAGEGEDCRAVLRKLDRTKIMHIERGCDDLDANEVPIPEGSACVGVTLFGDGDLDTMYRTWNVRLIARSDHLPFRAPFKATIHRVLMFHQETIVD